MKKIHLLSLLLIATAIAILSLNSCKKKEEVPPPPTTCKTCKATGIDGSVQKQVCTAQEETDFRNQNAGKQITCQ